ncbi:carbohydrate ABC transporter permease [Atrimonas thermophila]|uniref:carbohydrate ABC transporter permease n=1 Tax=Atrimonas thermophila TaxID=3064161 RepID=UPI00399D03A6
MSYSRVRRISARRRHLRQWFHDIITYIVIIIFFLPVLWIVLTSMRPEVEVNARPPVLIPQKLVFDSFVHLFGAGYAEKSVPFYDYLSNSLFASLVSTAMALIIGTFAGYSFARFRFRGSSVTFVGLMLARSIPGIAVSLPLFILFARMGLLDKKMGLALAYVAMNVPFTTWLMQGFFKDIPPDLDEAAQIDGCSRWQSFTKIDLPLALPGLAASGIFAFLTSWNEFQIASVITRTPASKTFPVGLYDFTQQFTVDWRGMCAMSVVMLVPAIVFVILTQRQLVRGLTFGAFK